MPSPEALPHVLLADISLGIPGSLDSLPGSVVVDDVTGPHRPSNKALG